MTTTFNLGISVLSEVKCIAQRQASSILSSVSPLEYFHQATTALQALSNDVMVKEGDLHGDTNYCGFH